MLGAPDEIGQQARPDGATDGSAKQPTKNSHSYHGIPRTLLWVQEPRAAEWLVVATNDKIEEGNNKEHGCGYEPRNAVPESTHMLLFDPMIERNYSEHAPHAGKRSSFL
jgi:hypothetical protein